MHEGTCGTHQLTHKMKLLIRRLGYYSLMLLEDYFKYYRGYQECQNFGVVQISLASAVNPIIKPWSFRGWGMYMISQIHPSTSKGYKWILAVTNYFTKWVEAILMKNFTTKDVIRFIKKHITYRFGIPQTITMYQGSVFILEEFGAPWSAQSVIMR